MAMTSVALPIFHDQLLDRRQKLETAATLVGASDEVETERREVDAALGRIDAGTFGLCATCHDPVEPERLLADPLTQFCLDHLTPNEQRALEQDLELAARIQRGLLPRAEVQFSQWHIAFHYQPAGPVSGDYLDVIAAADGGMYFLLGDVAGKGVSAALLMSHLSALLRTLISADLPLSQLMERASRVFCESTLPAHYATLVCGRASADGQIEICNAGHPPPLLVRAGDIARVDATGLPIGMFASERFSSQILWLARGEMLLLYTDGVLETENASGKEYGIDRLSALAASTDRHPKTIIDACLSDLGGFRAAPRFADDLTLLALSRP